MSGGVGMGEGEGGAGRAGGVWLWFLPPVAEEIEAAVTVTFVQSGRDLTGAPDGVEAGDVAGGTSSPFLRVEAGGTLEMRKV